LTVKSNPLWLSKEEREGRNQLVQRHARRTFTSNSSKLSEEREQVKGFRFSIAGEKEKDGWSDVDARRGKRKVWKVARWTGKVFGMKAVKRVYE